MIAWTDIESSGFDERDGHLFEVAIVVTDDNLNEVSHFDTVVQPTGVDVVQVPMDQIVKDMHEKNGLLASLRAGHGMRRCEAEAAIVAYLTQLCSVCDGDGWKATFSRAQEVAERDGCPNNCMGQAGKLAGSVELDVCVHCKKKREEHYGVPGSDIVGCPAPDLTLTQKMTRFQSKQVTLASQTPLAGSTVGFDRRWLRHQMPKLEALFSHRSVDVSSVVELAKRWAPTVYEARPKAKDGAAHRALADVRESIAYLRYFRDRGFIGGGNFT